MGKTYEGYNQAYGAAIIDMVLEVAGLRFGCLLIEIAVITFA